MSKLVGQIKELEKLQARTKNELVTVMESNARLMLKNAQLASERPGRPVKIGRVIAEGNPREDLQILSATDMGGQFTVVVSRPVWIETKPRGDGKDWFRGEVDKELLSRIERQIDHRDERIALLQHQYTKARNFVQRYAYKLDPIAEDAKHTLESIDALAGDRVLHVIDDPNPNQESS